MSRLSANRAGKLMRPTWLYIAAGVLAFGAMAAGCRCAMQVRPNPSIDRIF
jgi:hypothetical protein